MSDCPADDPGGYQQREEQKPDEDLTDRNRRVSLPLSCHSRTLPAGTGARRRTNYPPSGGDDPHTGDQVGYPLEYQLVHLNDER